MSDERLREFERRWRATGSINDEAALIQERIRVGDIKRERVRAAAILGYPVATLVVTHHKCQKRSFLHALRVRGVGAQGWVRALVVILRTVCRHFRHDPYPARVRSMIRLAERWVTDPDDRSVLSEAWNEGNRCGLDALGLPDREAIPLRVAGLLSSFLRCPVDDFEWVLKEFIATNPLMRRNVPCLTYEGIQTALEPVLGPWLLGYSDPLPPRPPRPVDRWVMTGPS